MKVYKGTDKDIKCRGYQFTPGVEAVEDSAELCKSGFHACEAPLDVLGYYPPGLCSRYFEAELEDVSPEREHGNSKVCGKRITLGAEIGIPGLVKAHIEWVKSQMCQIGEGEHATGDQVAASATGYLGAASATGEQGAASATGTRGAASATGEQGAASATGYLGAASATGTRGAAAATGYQGAASATGYLGAASATGYLGAASATGYHGAASATGYHGAASATGEQGAAAATGEQGAAAATGYHGAAAATGYHGAASATGEQGAAAATGYQGAASVNDNGGIAVSAGFQGKAKAGLGSAICICERGDWDGKIYPLLTVRAIIVDGEALKADTWYTLKNGEFVEVADDE